MPVWMHIMFAPFASFFMMLVWASLIGDTFVHWHENNMLEEWIICILIWVIGVVIFKIIRKYT